MEVRVGVMRVGQERGGRDLYEEGGDCRSQARERKEKPPYPPVPEQDSGSDIPHGTASGE